MTAGLLVHQERQLGDARDDDEVEEELFPRRVPLGLGGGRVAGRRLGRGHGDSMSSVGDAVLGGRCDQDVPFAHVFWTGDR